MNNTLPRLSNEELLKAQNQTLDTPRLKYGIFARLLFMFMDRVYGKEKTFQKSKVLELIARVPYQTWEHVAYVAITHTASDTKMARRIFDRVEESREQQDNEQWHLLILEEIVEERGIKQPWIKYRALPQIVAFIYYQLSWLLFVIRPKWSYKLNADFEDHAEHEYMMFVKEHPEFETMPWHSDLATEYGHVDTFANLFRQIGHDERVHKQESLDAMKKPRFT